MFRKPSLCAICLVLLCDTASGQSTYNKIVRDTIITIPGILHNTYLLDGKKMTLPVMDWFMMDYPAAHDEINLALLSNQASIAGYTIGGLFGLSGLLIYQRDKALGGDLLQLGGIGIGTGITFQVFSGIFKRRAVRTYNRAVINLYKKQGTAIHTKVQATGINIQVQFE